MLPLQQPFGHVLALQTHAPAWHVCPAPHAAPPPQRHCPPVHVFVAPEHGVQAAPPWPQAAAVCAAGAMHWPALQQPLGQLVASHTQTPGGAQREPVGQGLFVPHLHAPDVHRSAAEPQAAHEAPFGPHCVAERAVTHVLPSQQPFVHVVELHTHWPLTQA